MVVLPTLGFWGWGATCKEEVLAAHAPPRALVDIPTVAWNETQLKTLLEQRVRYFTDTTLHIDPLCLQQPIKVTGAPVPQWSWDQVALTQEGGRFTSAMRSDQPRFFYYGNRYALCNCVFLDVVQRYAP